VSWAGLGNVKTAGLDADSTLKFMYPKCSQVPCSAHFSVFSRFLLAAGNVFVYFSRFFSSPNCYITLSTFSRMLSSPFLSLPHT